MTQNELLVSKGLVTVQEAAQFLRLSRSTIYQMMDRGELTYAKIRGSRRIPKVGLNKLAQDCLMGGFKLEHNAT